MKAYSKWIFLVPGALAVVGGCALPGLHGPKAAGASGADLALAKRYEQHGELESARQVYRGLIDSKPDEAAAYHRLGVVAAKEGDFARADLYFRQAHALEPGNVDLLNDAGYAYFLQGRLGEAEEFLKLALRRDPNNARAKNNLGLVLGRQGRVDESLAMFRQVVPEAEAYANLAHATGHAAEGAGASELYRSEGAVNEASFERVQSSGLAQQSARVPQRAPRGSREIRPMRRGANDARIAQRSSSPAQQAPEGAPRAVRAQGVAAARAPQPLGRPRWSREQWMIERSQTGLGAPAPARSSAQRVTARLAREPSMSGAAVAAARGSAVRDGAEPPRTGRASRIETPRLFAPLLTAEHSVNRSGRPVSGGAESARAPRTAAARSSVGSKTAPRAPGASSSQGPEIVYLNRASAKSQGGPEIVYLHHNSTENQAEGSHVKILFGPETRGE